MPSDEDFAHVRKAIHAADVAVLDLRAMVPDEMAFTATRNRLAMALTALDNARDFVVAAKDRMPEPS